MSLCFNFILLIFYLLFFVQPFLEEINVTPEVTSEVSSTIERAIAFPTYPLECPSELEVTDGPTWRSITIGQSTIADVEDLYGVQVVLDMPTLIGETGNSYYILLTPEAARERHLSQRIDICTVKGKIIAMTLQLGTDEYLPSGWIRDWIQLYGRPEVVSWAAIGNDWRWRVVVWPKHGVAAMVDVQAITNDPNAALVNSVTFFPYAEGKDYLNQWPYSALHFNAPTSVNEGYPVEVNPFNFELLLEPAAE